MTHRSVIVKLPTGLHLRPAALFTQEACKYESEITLQRGDMKVDAKSVMGVMALGAGPNTEVLITAEGPDEQEAVEALSRLLEAETIGA